mmetsp:Transcript_10700/g.24384  ORF Transcript_10700/g.24384 Transcript_10700/m.24384 type:complete len:447 (+) Transcript_10700:70-1410(+)
MQESVGLTLLGSMTLAVSLLLTGCSSSDNSIDGEVAASGSFLSTTVAPRTGGDNESWPFTLMQCPTGEVISTQSLTCAQYDSMVATIRSIYSGLDSTCTATVCPQADWAGCVLRIAGHDFMDYGNGQGGSDGCLDLSDPDNAGLPDCLHMGEEFGSSIYDAYKMHCSEISLADFVVLAAEAVITLSREHVTQSSSGRGSIDFRSNFRFGRSTATSCTWAEGRLPNPEHSCTAVEETFLSRMGLSWREATALMGVHTLGRARPENSGYDGWWSDAVNSRKFNNNYFASILGKGWIAERLSAGKNQWKRADAGRDRGSTDGKEMMLNTDMCLAFSEDRQGRTELRADTADCCTWTDPDNLQTAIQSYLGGEYCGSTSVPGRVPEQRERCCNDDDRDIDCGDFNEPRGSAFEDVREFANDEAAWLQVFLSSWKIATENGFSNLQPLGQC